MSEGARDRDDVTYQVVVNHEEQYSVWPTDRDAPDGWWGEGTTGTREECLDHIERVWVDMRPLSVRGGGETGADVPAAS
ncbi:MbtH family protein [Streptomyces sp. NPDC050856]|uniref:MbtH family protein n=1 Tax=Streptomyces sp. NPDC050856 TaxID=3154939 RepID=UPI0033F69AB2